MPHPAVGAIGNELVVSPRRDRRGYVRADAAEDPVSEGQARRPEPRPRPTQPGGEVQPRPLHPARAEDVSRHRQHQREPGRPQPDGDRQAFLPPGGAPLFAGPLGLVAVIAGDGESRDQQHRGDRPEDPFVSHARPHQTSRAVAYMMATPTRSPPRFEAESAGVFDRVESFRRSCVTSYITWRMAPAPTARKMAASRLEKAKPPIQVPTMAGPPPSNASHRKCTRRGLSLKMGAAMPTPSVMLCSVKPTTRKTPSAASPRANAAPMASPSPRLCSPIPSAIRYEVPSRLDSSRPRRSSRSVPRSPSSVSRVSRITSGIPEKIPGSAAATSTASSSVSTTRKASSPTVSASTKFMPEDPSRLKNGYQSSPKATGITPT